MKKNTSGKTICWIRCKNCSDLVAEEIVDQILTARKGMLKEGIRPTKLKTTESIKQCIRPFIGEGLYEGKICGMKIFTYDEIPTNVLFYMK